MIIRPDGIGRVTRVGQMKRATGVLLTGLLCAPHGVLAKQDPPVTLILRDNYVVSGTADDLPITLVVDGATPDRPVLNPEFVERAQIGTSLIGARFLIGPIVLKANTKVVKYSFDQREWKRRSLWADRAYADGYNGGVGPGGIPHDIVRFEMLPAQPGNCLSTSTAGHCNLLGEHPFGTLAKRAAYRCLSLEHE